MNAAPRLRVSRTSATRGPAWPRLPWRLIGAYCWITEASDSRANPACDTADNFVRHGTHGVGRAPHGRGGAGAMASRPLADDHRFPVRVPMDNARAARAG